jgi:small-conductance mechanosensitive channel
MKILIALVILMAYLLSVGFVNRFISQLGRSRSINAYRIKYVIKALNIALSAVYMILLFMLLGIEYAQLTLFLSSVFAVIGIALFAQWSILSNVTASLIIFFSFPYRVGDSVKVIDKDDDVSGVIEEITLFHVLIRKNKDLITYPNTLIMQKAVVKLSDSEFKVDCKDDKSDETLLETKHFEK